jgi:hypothetical protein
MAKRKNKIGSSGPQPYWLRMSVGERLKTKQYIKEGLLGFEREDGVKVPAARSIYKGLSASDGYDLSHIERWSAQRLKSARMKIQALNTLTSRPFSVVRPRNRQQRLEAQKYTGQNLPNQKQFIAHVQIQGRDKAIFKNGKVGVEREFESGSKTIKSRYMLRDYLRDGDTILDAPTTFREMREITVRMLEDMPKNVYGQPAFFALVTPQYGAFGRMVTHGKVLDLIAEYMNRYDPGGTSVQGRGDFGEHIGGFQMVGTLFQANEMVRERLRLKTARKERNKLRFVKKRKPVMCTVINKKTGRRCERRINHKGKHRFPK